MEKEQLAAIASQLGHPSGEKGTEIAQMMNETNIGMTKNAISNLKLNSGDSILELGHGNGGHLEYLFSVCENVQYTGLEISSLMCEEAQQVNKSFMNDQKAQFFLYDGEIIPFEADTFNKLFTVNTLYFWKDPSAMLSELSRVLKPKARFSLTFAHRSFMEMLPFTAFGFTLYNPEEVLGLIDPSNFKVKQIDTQKELVSSKTGESMERQFSTFVLENNKSQ
jgi:ubiquinone/menaquinone biosynthesis C-methylase UbiE